MSPGLKQIRKGVLEGVFTIDLAIKNCNETFLKNNYEILKNGLKLHGVSTSPEVIIK